MRESRGIYSGSLRIGDHTGGGQSYGPLFWFLIIIRHLIFSVPTPYVSWDHSLPVHRGRCEKRAEVRGVGDAKV